MATDTRPRTRKVDVPASATTTGRPVSSPRHTRPFPATKPPQRIERIRPTAPVIKPRPQRGHEPPPRRGERIPPSRSQRMPFILLLVGLLGGAIVSLLVISTTLDAGAYRITNLTNQNTMLNKEIQVVSNDVANEQNPATIMGEAYRLGMRYDKYLRFIDTKAGKISSSNPVAP
jgi:hypothetical protein